ncbi:hypothetical protein L917_20268 [Phytophthora nicotianae]|uniref:GAF domain-containing protein n=1 Tax=Phytophthora nicotianae TaxID=4792 RepID=W2K3K9_PHYNI|nr:hypothetical protein L917_20268 [Phytophthora nicotianae]
MPTRSSSCSSERGELPSTNDSEHDHRQNNNVSSFSPCSSFFIIHESSTNVISPCGGTRNSPKLRRKGDENGVSVSIRARKERGLSSSGQHKKKARSKTPSSAPASNTTPSSTKQPQITFENHEEKIEGGDQSTAKKKYTMELSILNRCGSAPDLPMYSPMSASVYSSSKKRTLQGSANAATFRLTPLPANTRAAAMRPEPLLDSCEGRQTINAEQDAVPLHPKDPLIQEKLCKDAHTISVLKQRLLVLEREVSASTKYRHMADKHITQLSQENQRLQVEKTQQQARIEELDKTVLRQHHEYDKLAARYAAVYANLQKLVDQQNPSDNSVQQSALQALARENQDFLRKLRVLEARHAEDKTLTSNQEKKIKRLKAEIEALQHMSEAKSREDDYDEAASDTDQVSRLTKSKKRSEGDNNRPTSASPVSITLSTPRRAGSSARMQTVQTFLGTASHLVTAEAYQYIDPNILKVLEKVDSQFSITNAINLSVVLKKWLNSCVHVVCSTHLPTVLQTLLKRVCELLHCEHAALFTVDHATHKLIATCSERGIERWELPLDKGIAGYAVRHNTLCNVHCANDDPRFYSSTDSVTGTTSREVLALPIVHELQLYLDSHVKVNNSLGVFAVLRAWNTTHQKPFSSNDQILGSLLAIQAGIILRQTAVTKTLQKINHKTHQILQMPSDIVAKASTSSETPSLVQLVVVAQKELGDCLGIKQIRIFVLDAAAHKLWHAGEREADDSSSPALVRRYVNAHASLCALLLRSDAVSIVVPEPSAEAAFNDTVDIPGGARGLYLAPILSPWNTALPLGMVQVSRVAKARLSASPFTLTASEAASNGTVSDVVVNNEREAAQQTEDRLMLELLGLFCRGFAGLLHHVTAQQLYDTCSPEIMQAQLATLADHLDSLARRQREDEEEAVHASEVEIPGLDHVRQSDRHASVATVHAVPANRDTRRVASAEPRHRAAPESRRATTSPAKRSSDIHQTVSGALQSGDSSEEVFQETGANGVDVPTPPDTVNVAPDTSISTSDVEDRRDAEAIEPGDSELPALNPDQQAGSDVACPVAYDAAEVYTSDAPVVDDWTTATSGDNGYAAAHDEEQLADADGAEYTWGDNNAYDPSSWNAGTYEEDVAWNYDGALMHEDDTTNRGDSQQSTNSAYAIDVHLSRTPSADTDQPSGAL